MRRFHLIIALTNYREGKWQAVYSPMTFHVKDGDPEILKLLCALTGQPFGQFIEALGDGPLPREFDIAISKKPSDLG